MERSKIIYAKEDLAKNSQPLVSVRLMAYNNIDYVEDAINSILNQKTDFHFELCIGDDSSNDGTTELCEKYYENHPDKIRLFVWNRDHNEHQKLPSSRFNFINTIKQCRGKYLAY
jgi:glycosyltransferase involved in cell wall biosynthesis